MTTRGCDVEGCDRPHKSKGYCDTHYMRWQRSGDPGPAITRPRRARTGSCEGPECSDAVYAAGFCSAHYEMQRQGKPLVPKRRYLPRGVACTVGACERPALSEGLCDPHYRRHLTGRADWDAPIEPRAPIGSGHIDANGYRVISVKGRRRFEHKAIMERLIGRALLPRETVHHCNGQRADNRVNGPLDERFRSGNLELWSKAQPAGQRVADKVDFAVEVLALYAPHLLAAGDTLSAYTPGERPGDREVCDATQG